jgi:hypothetical protein
MSQNTSEHEGNISKHEWNYETRVNSTLAHHRVSEKSRLKSGGLWVQLQIHAFTVADQNFSGMIVVISLPQLRSYTIYRRIFWTLY